MQFNVGDTVRVVATRPADPSLACPVDWVDEMDDYLGQQGKVSSVDEYRGTTCFTVAFPDGESWSYLLEWLVPAVDVGDEVSWRLEDSPYVQQGRVISVGTEKLCVWNRYPANSYQVQFIKHEWLVTEAEVAS